MNSSFLNLTAQKLKSVDDLFVSVDFRFFEMIVHCAMYNVQYRATDSRFIYIRFVARGVCSWAYLRFR